MTEKKLATFQIDGATWQAFQDKAGEGERTASGLMREFVERFIEGSLEAATPPTVAELEQRIEARLQQFEGELLGKLRA